VILTRFADDYPVGFEHRDDVERFLADLRERFATFALKRITSKKRMRTKLSEVKAELMRRRARQLLRGAHQQRRDHRVSAPR